MPFDEHLKDVRLFGQDTRGSLLVPMDLGHLVQLKLDTVRLPGQLVVAARPNQEVHNQGIRRVGIGWADCVLGVRAGPSLGKGET